MIADNAVHARQRAWSRASAMHAHSRDDAQRLPPPAARSGEAASTALGEVGGAQRPKAASTDGCHRLTLTCYEGAAAEREGFEPSVRLPVHLISSQAPSTTRSPLQVSFGAKRAESGSRRGECQR